MPYATYALAFLLSDHVPQKNHSHVIYAPRIAHWFATVSKDDATSPCPPDVTNLLVSHATPVRSQPQSCATRIDTAQVDP